MWCVLFRCVVSVAKGDGRRRGKFCSSSFFWGVCVCGHFTEIKPPASRSRVCWFFVCVSVGGGVSKYPPVNRAEVFWRGGIPIKNLTFGLRGTILVHVFRCLETYRKSICVFVRLIVPERRVLGVPFTFLHREWVSWQFSVCSAILLIGGGLCACGLLLFRQNNQK